MNVQPMTADDLVVALTTDNPEADLGNLQLDAELIILVRAGKMEAGRDLDTGKIVFRPVTK